jgi:capsid protein
MSWASIEVLQKQLERRLLDFISYKTVQFAAKDAGMKLPPEWVNNISWSWPSMREVDEGRTIAAQAQKIKTGLTTYKQLLGPDWEDRFEQLATELAKAKVLELPLPAFESVAGAVLETAPDEDTEKSDEND